MKPNTAAKTKITKIEKWGWAVYFSRYCETLIYYYYYSTTTKVSTTTTLLLSLLLYTFLNLYLTPRWHCQKDGQFLMSTVTARALPSLKKFSYNDKHDTLTIYYYYKIPRQFCPPARKYPSPLLFSMPQPSLPLIIIKQDGKFSFDDWIQNLAHFLNNLT